jgi:glutathione peroxidase|tara:strand:- start:1161 stop:1763 length:603 start_codon:yes stop_codon:yes gene_type:complete
MEQLTNNIWIKTSLLLSVTVLTSFFLFLMFFFNSSLSASPENQSISSIYDIKLESISGVDLDLETYRGKKILIVNVASNCGFTSQYKALQDLYDQYGDKIEVIAIPCNDFGGQEPGSSKEIIEFCSLNYSTTFPFIAKSNIKSTPQHPLYTWLSDPSLNGWNKKLPSWNFCKYLINEKGELTHFFRSNISPTSKKITSLL